MGKAASERKFVLLFRKEIFRGTMSRLCRVRRGLAKSLILTDLLETWVKFYLALNIFVFLADILVRMDVSSGYSVKVDAVPLFVLL